MPAKTITSYKNTLYKILDWFQPKRCFEYGSGTSSQILALYPSVEYVKSVEHNEYFFNIINNLGIDCLEVVLKADEQEYVNELNEKYDLVFVDGRSRAESLNRSKNYSDIVILHDAAREDYREAVNSYKYQIWTDDGNTVVLTDSDQMNNDLKLALSDIECKEPFPEKIIFKSGYSI